MSVKIYSVDKGSYAEKKGIKAGDILLTVNGNEINDVLDYRFYLTEKKIKLLIKTEKSHSRLAVIHKVEAEDIGLQFETYLMDKQHSCKNKCIFCFIDQLPANLRDSLYFKDDDSRLSFLFGNYVTLTNLDDAEVQRIIKMHISPVNISVHTTNPDLRVKMMANPHAGESLKYLKQFAGAGISINAQLVLCPGINDGKELEFSLNELLKLYPALNSIACVPVGLTKHREGLYPLKEYDKASAGEVIDLIDSINAKFEKENGVKLAYASDEFYLTAERKMPCCDYYDGFPQLENGVGMWSLLKDEFYEALNESKAEKLNRKVIIVTGSAAFPLIKELSDEACKKFSGLNIDVYEVKNRLFGESITVSGLITGGDIVHTLKGKEKADEIIIPPNCLRAEGDMFLDDMTVSQLEEMTGMKVRQNGSSGAELLSAMKGE